MHDKAVRHIAARRHVMVSRMSRMANIRVSLIGNPRHASDPWMPLGCSFTLRVRFLRRGANRKPHTRIKVVPIPISGSPFPLTRSGTMTSLRTGRARPAFRLDDADRPAAELPALPSDCRDCTARTRCLITPWLVESISPAPASLPNRVVGRGSHIFWEGDTVAGIYAIQSGMINSYIYRHER